jgi:IPT/TIG domain
MTSVSPTSGDPGTKVRINGPGLMDATSVTFNGTPAIFEFEFPTIVTHVPTGATTGPVVVTTPEGTAVSSTDFVILAITSFSPRSGPVGTRVRIIGTGFTQATAVAFRASLGAPFYGHVAASFNVIDDSTIVAIVPAGAISGRIIVYASSFRSRARSDTSFHVT